MGLTLWIPLGLLALINISVTWIVALSSTYSRTQKTFQILLIWILPIFGALLCWHVLRGIRPEKHSTDFTNEYGYGDSTLYQGDAVDHFPGGHDST